MPHAASVMRLLHTINLEVAMPTKAELENQIVQLQRIEQELQRIDQKLDEQIPDLIKKLITESDAFTQCIAEIGKGKNDVETMVSDANTAREEHIAALEAKNAKLAKSHQQHLDESVETISDLTEGFKNLAGKTFSNKSSDMIADEYRCNANFHKENETKFQYIGGGSIIGAILILLGWLALVNCGLVSKETEYHWLPVATITSLCILLSRWSARIAYRHGLEARRLNQFALELTAMPAFFAQELLNQGDTEFQTEGKKIVQEKSSKMFGNFERFDEQQSHSVMELMWKWVTKKFETSEDKKAVSSLNEEDK